MFEVQTRNSGPQLAVGAAVFKDGNILLVKRRNPPAQNQWTIPGGRVNKGETLQKAVEREIFEETQIRIQAKEAVYVFDVIERDLTKEVKVHYVIIDYQATYISGEPKAGDDALEARWFSGKDFENNDINSTTRQFLKKIYNFPS